LLEAKAGSGFGGAVCGDGGQMFRGNGHDTTLLMMRTQGLRSCTYWTLEMRGKVLLEGPWFSPKGGMSIRVRL
jgi:hypothetical protein